MSAPGPERESEADPAADRIIAHGERAAAVRSNQGIIQLGDHASATVLAPRPPLPPATQVPAPTGLVVLPRRPSRVFVGRQDALARLAETMTDGLGVITQAVHGLGGVGKSELALHYANRYRDRYTLVWWIDADNPAQIRTNLAELAQALTAQRPDLVEEGVAWVLAWLATHPGWLLIFDNVDHLDHIQPYLGRLTGGHVLITTRRDLGWDQIGTSISLDHLHRAASLDLLSALLGPAKSAAPEQREQLETLADRLGDLPLALTQAGSYIARTPRTGVAGYLRLLETSPARMYATAPVGGDAQRVIAQIWEITRARIERLDPLAVRVLDLLAYFAPDHLPCQVLGHLDGTDEVQINQALALLASYSMITISADADHDMVSVHRLVQAVTQHRLTPAQQDGVRRTAADLLHATLPGTTRALDAWPVYRRLLPHARTVFPPDAPGLREIVDYLEGSGDYTTARILQEDIYLNTLNRLGPEHPQTLDAHTEFARWIGHTGNSIAARDMFATILAVRQRVSGPEHPDTLTVHTHLVDWIGQAGDPAGARDVSAALLPIRRRVSGDEHPETLRIWGELGFWTGQAGDPAGARDHYAAFLPIRERVLGTEHSDTLSARDQYARWVGEAGDPVGARDMCSVLLPAYERTAGIEHPDTLWARTNLAWWTGQAGDPAGARDQYAALLPIRERVSGPEHPSTLIVRANLAWWTGQAGDPAGARDQYAALLPVRERVSGPEHPDTLTARADLASWTEHAKRVS